MKDLFFSWTAVIGGALLSDVNTALAALSYLSASIYTGVKLYQYFKNGRTK
jgi:hypothetical protein